jgi:signal peptidase I
MNFDFALILVIATLVTGIGWLIDKMIYEKPRTATFSKAQEGMDAELTKEMKEKLDTTPWWSDFSRSMFPVLAIVLIVRSFLVEPFQIPSGSMLPTLKIGDFILVNKYDYGLRLPVLGTKVIPVGEPERGDVVVFKFPNDPSVNYIKRLIGLPGDVITYKDKKIYVNGELQNVKLEAKLPPMSPRTLLLEENLSGVTHEIYNDVGTPGGFAKEWTVPEGQYFVMGDNRDNSNDSRYWGFVPDSLLVGRAFAVWMHWPTFTSIPDFTAARGIE